MFFNQWYFLVCSLSQESLSRMSRNRDSQQRWPANRHPNSKELMHATLKEMQSIQSCLVERQGSMGWSKVSGWCLACAILRYLEGMGHCGYVVQLKAQKKGNIVFWVIVLMINFSILPWNSWGDDSIRRFVGLRFLHWKWFIAARGDSFHHWHNFLTNQAPFGAPNGFSTPLPRARPFVGTAVHQEVPGSFRLEMIRSPSPCHLLIQCWGHFDGWLDIYMAYMVPCHPWSNHFCMKAMGMLPF